MKPVHKISNHIFVAVFSLSLSLTTFPGYLDAAAASKQGSGKFAVKTKKPKTSQKITGCAKIRVNVAKLAYDGRDWDLWTGERALPDLVLMDLASNTKTRQCHDTFSCSYNISVKGKNIKVRIIDVDTVDADDVIGEGVCSLSRKTCQIGKARLSISSC